MPAKKHSVEQIIGKLREIEKLTAQGMSIPLAAKKVGAVFSSRQPLTSKTTETLA